MGRQLLPQTEKASKYFCVCFLPLTACWRRQCVKFTCFFCAVVSYCVELCLSSFRLFSLIPMSILRRCYLNNWVGYTGTWFSFLGHFLLHCRANSSIVDNCWMPMLLCVSSYIFITSNIFFGSPGSVLRRMKMNLIQICWGPQLEMVYFVSLELVGLQLLLQSIFKPFLSWDAGPPESVFDWTREIDSDLSNQNINNQAFSRKHWRLLQCQDGLLHLFTW